MSDLPPLDQPQAYVVVGPNDQRGPYALDLLLGEVLTGRLNEATPVWWPGLADWTTLGGHPGTAAEIARRRGGYAHPPAPPAGAAPAAGQYAETDAYAAGPAQAAAAAPSQDMSTGAYVAGPAGVETAPDAGTPDGGDVPVASTESATAGAGVSGLPDDATAEVSPAEWLANGTGDREANDRASADEHADLTTRFVTVVDRSGAVASAVDRVEGVGTAFGGAVEAAATSLGYAITDDADPDDGIFAFDGASGDRLVVVMGSVAGADPTTFRSAVPLDVRVENDIEGITASEGTGAHGEVVVSTAEWGGAASAQVSLFLPIADYVADDLTVDTATLERDVAAVIHGVRSAFG
jgi:hypothetical protein